MSPFSRDYKPQIDADKVGKEVRASKTATANREAGLRSDDPQKRLNALGTVPGMKSLPTKADKGNSRM